MPTTNHIVKHSDAGSGSQVARIEVRNVVLLAAELRNNNAGANAELGDIFLERGRITNLAGNPVGLINGYADANNPLNWTGRIELDGDWVISGEAFHFSSVVHQLKLLVRSM